MKKLIPFILCLFFLAACDKNKDLAEPVVPVQPVPVETYKFKDIKYTVEEGDIEKEFQTNSQSSVFINRTSVTQQAVVVPEPMETSYFPK
ncbi:hypothetical protein AAKU52_000272 [Pedobacter sp. CG_S7]|uniref:hypothetical protein n=1 Tax=Pedobacter sp. CG_S7 TaxID=3143930 RepID=UPI0033910632